MRYPLRLWQHNLLHNTRREIGIFGISLGNSLKSEVGHDRFLKYWVVTTNFFTTKFYLTKTFCIIIILCKMWIICKMATTIWVISSKVAIWLFSNSFPMSVSTFPRCFGGFLCSFDISVLSEEFICLDHVANAFQSLVGLIHLVPSLLSLTTCSQHIYSLVKFVDTSLCFR